MERMKKPKFIKEIEKSEGKERAKCGRWYIRVYGELDHKPMVELESLEIVIKELHKLEEENKKLNEKVRFLEECLDRKEKLNEKYREDLEECECSFGFENDEVGFWKGEYKRLKKWIKDHCKGYGNLFPEDEMKRQRKKADKKRKKAKEDDELIYEEGLYD